MQRILPIPAPFSAPLLCAALLLAASGAQAAQGTKATADDAQQRYQQERQMCMAGNPQETRASCLREAAAALQAARRGQLGGGSATDYEQNATKRCTVFRDTGEVQECLLRLKNPASGSVAGGGVLREAVTTGAPQIQPERK